MGVRRNNLFAYFRRASAPEAYKYLMLLLPGGTSFPEYAADKEYLTYKGAPFRLFREWARRDAAPLTTDSELATYHQRAEEDMRAENGDGTLFQLLLDYARHNLRFDDGTPMVRHDDLLGWQDITTLLGQDLLVCAFLAKKDTTGTPRVYDFTWPAIIPSDNAALRRVLEKGLAENHAHLFAAAQYFDLTWSALTNFYEEIDGIAAKITENLNDDPQDLSAKDWRLWLRRAALLRCALFGGPAGRDAGYGLLRSELKAPDAAREYPNRIGMLRNKFGFRFPEYNQPYDYAFTASLARDNIGHPNRALAGERHFLYMCFRGVFTGAFGGAQRQMFYLYLLIKSRFRGELVHSNRRAGFDNFARFHNRNAIIPDNSMYGGERICLAINSTLRDGSIKSLELRVSPRAKASENIINLEKIVSAQDSLGRSGKRRGSPFNVRPANGAPVPKNPEQEFFFVYHLPKGKETPPKLSDTLGGGLCLTPRNCRERSASRDKVLAIAEMLNRYRRAWTWIRGIDGCSAEIGCRPEVMAHAIRFISNFAPNPPVKSVLFVEKRRPPRIGKTFHAGEDFLDLVDGLRAVDEAMLFLNLGRGDRLGHAVALGLDAEEYYRRKASKITLRKQDTLDNLTWMLCRSAELGVRVKQDLDSRLRGIAGRIAQELYGGTEMSPEKFDLHNYFRAWKLRGDDPYAYFSGGYKSAEKQNRGILKHAQEYMDYALNGDGEITFCRNDEVAARLCKAYHFFGKVRTEGNKICSFAVAEDFVALARELQAAMRRRVSDKDIAVETNPTSNKLISTFGRYDKHPIFTFYSRHLDKAAGPQLYVSVNTDDQGVFSTSLRNEYALLSRALELVPDAGGAERYSRPQIRDWIDDVREMGMSQTFPAT
ncbi:MAG: hypothetical protein LBD49_00565 [Oscillospiraceae bacterium]|jgi:hypothetical protein|nr:hypothetical protein [Oscillospiraceae bacterium]